MSAIVRFLYFMAALHFIGAQVRDSPGLVVFAFFCAFLAFYFDRDEERKR